MDEIVQGFINYVDGANTASFRKVAEAVLDQGLVYNNKGAARQTIPTARGSSACLWRGPSGTCRDLVLKTGQKSGRCDDYV
jgi:hypothetical protein